MSTPSTCVPRPVLATGETAHNSRTTEFLRRYLESHLPHGALKAVAVETGKDLARTYREIEGEAVLSIDLVLAALPHLDLEDRLRLIAYVCNPLGIVVYGKAERMDGEPS